MERSKIINKEYMDWLEKFTTRNGNFDTKSIGYEINLSSTDKINLNNLHNLYNEIKDYAIENKIEESWTNQYSYYSIKYNGKGYSLLHSNSQDGLMICFKNNNLDNIDIDCNFILENHKNVKKLTNKRDF